MRSGALRPGGVGRNVVGAPATRSAEHEEPDNRCDVDSSHEHLLRIQHAAPHLALLEEDSLTPTIRSVRGFRRVAARSRRRSAAQDRRLDPPIHKRCGAAAAENNTRPSRRRRGWRPLRTCAGQARARARERRIHPHISQKSPKRRRTVGHARALVACRCGGSFTSVAEVWSTGGVGFIRAVRVLEWLRSG